MSFPCYIIIDTDCPNCRSLMEWKHFQQWVMQVRRRYHVQVIDRHTAYAMGLGVWTCDEWGRLVFAVRTPALWCMGELFELVDDNCFKSDPKRGRVIDLAAARIRLMQATSIIARCYSNWMRERRGRTPLVEAIIEEAGGRRGRNVRRGSEGGDEEADTDSDEP